MVGAKPCLLHTGAASWNCQFGCPASDGSKSWTNAGGSNDVGLSAGRFCLYFREWTGIWSPRVTHNPKSQLLHLGLKEHGTFRTNSWVATADVQLRTSLPGQYRYRKLRDELQTFCEKGLLEKALDVLMLMDNEGVTPTVNIYRSLLKACSKRKALTHAKQVHVHLMHYGCESSEILAEDVVSTFVKCGSLEDALRVFWRLPYRTVFLWTTVICGCTNAGQGQRALEMFRCMQEEGLEPNKFTFSSLLKACGSIADLQEAKRMHAEVSRYGCGSELFVRTCLVDMYAKCGSILDARDVFDNLSERDVHSWTAMLAAYAHQGQANETLHLYERMRTEGVSPNDRTFVSVLHACSTLAEEEDGEAIHGQSIKVKSLQLVSAIHGDVRRRGYEGDIFVCNTLIAAYGKCGSIVEAQSMFDGLLHPNVVSWTAIIAAYVQQGLADRALQLYEEMCEEGGTSPNIRTLAGVLQACCVLSEKEEHVLVVGQTTRVQSLQKGKVIHGDAWGKGYEPDVFLSSTLISLYGKCGSILDAKMVFDSLPDREVMVWTAMITACLQQEDVGWTLELYKQMRENGVSPNNQTLVCVLQACGMLADKGDSADGVFTKKIAFGLGRAIHADALRKSWDLDVFIGNTLVSFYGKYGSLTDALNVFTRLSKRDLVSWTAMLFAYTWQGEAERALALSEQMSEEGLSPDDRTIVGMLHACGVLAEKEEPAGLEGCGLKVRCLAKVKALHADAWRKGYQSNAFICSSLITTYARCGSVVDAQNMFDRLLHRNALSETAMLAAYVEHGKAWMAVELYGQMQEDGRSSNDRIFVSALQACGMLAEMDDVADAGSAVWRPLEMGRMVHADAWMNGGSDLGVFIGSALINMYGKCKSILDAQFVFDALHQRDVVAWTALLAAYVEQGQAEVALQLYARMQDEGVSPNNRTFVSTLQACCMLADEERATVPLQGQVTKARALGVGKAVHVSVWMKGYHSDVFVVSALLSMYAKCMSFADAEQLFNVSVETDVVLWNTILAAYVQQGHPEKVLDLYAQMYEEEMHTDDRTFVSALQACGMLADEEEDVLLDRKTVKLKSLEKGKALHADAQRKGLASGPFVGNTIVAMYGKCGSIADAEVVFDGLLEHDVVSWNAMLAACAREGQPRRSLQLYEQMQDEGVGADEITFLCMIQACSTAGFLDVCRQIHRTLVSSGNNVSVLLANTLIHAYGRCSSMEDAQNVFDTLPQPSLLSWNALIAGYARQGDYVASLQCYEKMRAAGIGPSGVTFLSLLSACSHSGLVDQGVEYFESMSRDHGITPEIAHYVTILDLLGRAGHFAKVEELRSTMPMQADLATWLCLLGACRKSGKVLLAEEAFESAVGVEPNHGAAYLLMSSIYSDAGMWDRAREVKELRPHACVWKKPGQTWMEYGQELYNFVAQGSEQPEQEQLYAFLRLVNNEARQHMCLQRFCERS